MKNDSKQKPEVEQIPQTEQERPIPPDFIPQPKKREQILEPQKEEEQDEV